MPLSRSMLLVFVFFFSIPVVAQQNRGAQVSRDAQALGLLNQALAASRGMAGIAAVQDYRASGRVKVFESSDRTTEGDITINGTASGRLRMDSYFSGGARSYVSKNGRCSKKD